ncbi:MAG: hypothetical protein QM808_16475 [Steroidobacteraceae bacterium]
MRIRYVALLLALVGSSAVLAKIDTSDLDVDVMRAMDDAIKDFEPSLGANNLEAANNDIAVLSEAYQWTHDYFKTKGADDAVAISQKGQALIADAEAAVKRGDLAKAGELARETTRNCKSCHDIYKTSITR